MKKEYMTPEIEISVIETANDILMESSTSAGGVTAGGVTNGGNNWEGWL